jgi:hypothetical protein
VAHRGEAVFCMLSIYHARTDKDSELFEIKLAFLIRKLSRHPATARGCNGAEDVLKFRQAYLSRDAIAIRLGTSKRTASAKSPPSQSTSEGSMEDKQHRNKHDGSIRVGAPSTWWMEALSGSGFAFRSRPARIAICHRHAGGVLLISRQKKRKNILLFLHLYQVSSLSFRDPHLRPQDGTINSTSRDAEMERRPEATQQCPPRYNNKEIKGRAERLCGVAPV